LKSSSANAAQVPHRRKRRHEHHRRQPVDRVSLRMKRTRRSGGAASAAPRRRCWASQRVAGHIVFLSAVPSRNDARPDRRGHKASRTARGTEENIIIASLFGSTGIQSYNAMISKRICRNDYDEDDDGLKTTAKSARRLRARRSLDDTQASSKKHIMLMTARI
jgi:hypothetical protein